MKRRRAAIGFLAANAVALGIVGGFLIQRARQEVRDTFWLDPLPNLTFAGIEFDRTHLVLLRFRAELETPYNAHGEPEPALPTSAPGDVANFVQQLAVLNRKDLLKQAFRHRNPQRSHAWMELYSVRKLEPVATEIVNGAGKWTWRKSPLSLKIGGGTKIETDGPLDGS